jgi:bifunctional polynucleotide phosphatase/kinase
MPRTGNGGTAVFPSHCAVFTRTGTSLSCYSAFIGAPVLISKYGFNRYIVAIVSNQGGLSLKPDPKKIKSDVKRLADFKAKVSAVFKQLELPISVYAATGHDRYRKPRIGMWEELLEDYDLEPADAIDREHSFFVGDAGGREAVPGVAAKDHSCVDRFVSRLRGPTRILALTWFRDFAANAGITFHTPEEYFLHEDSRPFAREFDPTVFLQEEAVKSTTAGEYQGRQPHGTGGPLSC